MKHLYAFFIVACLLVSPLLGADYFDPAKVGSSARMIRLGNVEGFSGQANTIFENPAGMYRIYKASLSLFTTTFMDEVTYHNFSGAVRMPVGILGFGMASVGVTDIPKTGEVSFNNGDQTRYYQIDSYEYANRAYKASYQFSAAKHLHYGVSATYYNTEIDSYSAHGANFDAGIIVDTEDLAVSILLRNVISNLTVNYSNGESEDLPLESVYSARYRSGRFTYFGQMKVQGSDKQFTKGGGINFSPRFLPIFNFSVGYKEIPLVQSIDGVTQSIVESSMTLGLGLDLYGVNFDYAYEQSDHVEFNGKHYFSVAVNY